MGDEDLVQSAFAKREMARMEARARVEEDLFTRVPLSKQERRRQKASTRNVNSLAAVGDFGDDVADLVERTEELDKVSRKRRLVDTVTEGYKKPSQDITSGEQDVPLRDTLGVSIFAFSLARFIASYRSFGCFPLHDRPGSKLMPHSTPHASQSSSTHAIVVERAKRLEYSLPRRVESPTLTMDPPPFLSLVGTPVQVRTRRSSLFTAQATNANGRRR